MSFYSHLEDVSKNFAISLGLDLKFLKLFAFSASASVKWMKSEVSSGSQYIAQLKNEENLMRAAFRAPYALSLSPDAQYMLDMITAPDEHDLKPFLDFIDRFGTHYFEEAYFGAVYQVTTVISESEAATHTQLEVEAGLKACAGFRKVGGCAGVDASGGFDKMFSESRLNSQKSIKYFGGSANLQTQSEPSGWHESIEKSPALVKGKLKSISELVKDATKKSLMEKAVVQYVLRQYVSNFDTSKLRCDDSGAIQKLDQFINQQMQNPNISAEEVEQTLVTELCVRE